MRTSFRPLLVRGLVVAVVALTPQAATAADLLKIYRLAQNNDPQFAAARHDLAAAREASPIARGAVLPQVDYSYARADNDESSATAPDSSFTSEQQSLTLRQTLFSWGDFVGLSRAEAEVAQAEANFAAARQELITRVAGAYFDVLSARDTLRFATAEKKAIQRQLEQARQRFDVGLIAVTDVKEARASFDLAVAREIDATNALEDAREALRSLTGRAPPVLAGVGPSLPLTRPEPTDPERWVQTALEQNPSFLAARSAAEASRHTLRQTRADHYPEIDLVARRSEQETQFAGSIPSDTTNESIGVELTWTLFSGGATFARTDQARSRFQSAQSAVVQARRSAAQQTRNAYRGLESSISRVRALAQAVESNQSAVEASRAGFRVGTRTSLDVLNALRDLFGAQRDLADARYEYIVNRLELKQAAGNLTESDVRLVNTWLSAGGP